MAGGQLHFEATIEDKDFNNKLNGMKKGVDGLGNDFKKSFDSQTGSISALNKQIIETTENIKKNEFELRKMNKQLSDGGKAMPGRGNLIKERDALSKIIEEDKGAVFGYRTEINKLRLEHTTLNKELLEVRRKMESLAIAGKTNTREYQLLSAKAKGYSETLKQVNRDTKELSVSTEQATKKSGGLKNVFTTVASYFGVFAGIQAVIGLIKGAFNTIVQFDSKLLNVSKTTGLAGKDLENLGVAIRGLSEELRIVSTDKLLGYATVAGQLGVKGTSDILAFTEALAKLEITSNISGEEGGAQIARFLTLTDGGVKNVADFGDEVTKLGNNFAATEAEIVKNSLAIAQNTGVYKLGRQEALAYGTATKSIGVEAELTGASIGRTFAQIDKSLRTGKGIENLSKITGKSVEDLKAQFKTDPNGVLYSFVQGLNAINKSGGSVNNALQAIGITAVRDQRVLGSLASNGFDVLTRALEDVQNASGAMQQEFDTASTKIANSIEGVKVSWENFILAVNGSENAIGSFVSKWMKGLSIIIDKITEATTSMQELRRISGDKIQQEAFTDARNYYQNYDTDAQSRKNASDYFKQLQKEESEIISNINKEREKLKVWNDDKLMADWMYFGLNKGGEAEDNITKLSNDLAVVQGSMKGINSLAEDYNSLKNKTNAISEETIDLEKTNEKASKGLNNILKQRLTFLDELKKAEDNLSQSTLSGLDLEKAKIEEVYQERLKKAKELKANQDAINRIESLKTKETEIVTFKAETEGIKSGLETLRKDYEDFENAKKQIGIQKATELYKEQLDISKTYQQALADEINNLSGRDLNDLEKARLAELMKLYADYNIQKKNDDRKQLEELYKNTLSINDRLVILREKFQKDLATIDSNFQGEEAEKRKKELEKQFKQDIKGLSDDITKEAEAYANVADLVAGSTRSQIESQIKSLQTFINSTKGLTKEQRESIQAMINNLERALPTALGASNESNTAKVQREYNQLNLEIEKLNKLVSKKEGIAEFADEVAILKANIASLQERQADLKFENIIASGQDIENLGEEFLKLSELIGGSDNAVGYLLGSLGNISKISGSVIASLGNIGKALKSIKDQGGLGSIYEQGKANGAGILGGISSVVGSILPIVTAVVNIISNISKKQKQAYQEFREWQKSVYDGELQYQALLRQRRFAEAGQDGVIAESLQAQIDEANKQMPELQAQYNKLLEELQQNGRYIIDRWREKSWGTSKTKTSWGDLIGVDYDELEKLYTENKLDDSGSRQLFEQIKKIKEEMEALGYTLEDLQQQLSEYLTGTSAQELSSTFADMFANGTNSAIEFGNVLEDVIRNAIISGFKARYIDEAMEGLFDTLAGFAGDDEGLEQWEIDEFNRLAQETLEGLNQQWSSLIDGLDIDFGNTEDFGAGAKDGIKRITETQADRLTGILTGVQVDVIASRQILFESKNLLSSSLDNLVKIESNTARTYQALERIESGMQNNQAQALGMP